jgi:hypothetical protein
VRGLMRACLHLCQHPLSGPLHPKTVLYSADSFIKKISARRAVLGELGQGLPNPGGVPHQGATHANSW